jgi:hypothetical protein
MHRSLGLYKIWQGILSYYKYNHFISYKQAKRNGLYIWPLKLLFVSLCYRLDGRTEASLLPFFLIR